MNLDLEIDGLAEFEQQMTALGPEFARTVAVRAVYDMGEVIQVSAQRRAPVLAKAAANRQPGELRDDIGFLMDAVDATLPMRTGGTVSPLYDGDAEGPGVYGKFVEYGSVHNPQPEPFLRPAVEEDGEHALDAAVVSIGSSLKQMKSLEGMEVVQG